MKWVSRILVLVILLNIFMPGLASTPIYAQTHREEIFTFLLSDEEFSHPMTEKEVQTFLESQSGILKDYSFQNAGYTVPASRAIAFYGELSGINPRVLLVILELKQHLLSESRTNSQAVQTMMGNIDPTQAGFANQLAWAVEELKLGFNDRYTGENATRVTLVNGKSIDMSPEVNAGTYALLRFLALGATETQWQKWISQEQEGFHETYSHLFNIQPEAQMPTSSSQTTLSMPTDMRLPWGYGDTWYYTGGPHSSTASSKTYSKAAVDYAPGGTTGCTQQSDAWVRAVKGGTVVYASCDFVRIDHGGGWSTSYFHLRNIQVAVNQTISAGTAIGHPSCNTGASCGWTGRATGNHVHFDIRSSNIPQRIQGAVLGGWTIQEAASDYSGTMVQGTSTKTASVYKTTNNAIRAYEQVDIDDGRTLASGQTLYGTRDPSTDEDNYFIQGTAGQELLVEMWKTSGSSLDTYVYVRNPGNNTVGTNDNNGSDSNSRLQIKLADSGRYQIFAKGFGASTGAYAIKATLITPTNNDVEDGTWLSHNQTFTGKLNSDADEDTFYFNTVTGRIISIKLWKYNSSVDTVLEVYNPTGSRIAFNDDSESSSNSWVVFIASTSGTYRIKARSYNHATQGVYQIRMRLVDANNLALGKTAWASSVENGNLLASRAVDGNIGSRWSSQFSSPQWIKVDLGANRLVDTAILRWETAYAKSYGIYYWTGSYWANLYWTSRGSGGTNMIRFSPITARYFMMYATERGTRWGVSLWEFGLYNSSTALPPDPEAYTDPAKEPDSIGDNPPPAATSPGKDEEVLALTMGEDGEQEFAPAEDTWPGDTTNSDVSSSGIPVAVIHAIQSDSNAISPFETFQFAGVAEDSNADGEIMAYEWRSSLDGVLSTDAEFTRTARQLSNGTHTITFRAQDNEGNWSPSVSEILTVQSRFYIFLPLVIRQ